MPDSLGVMSDVKFGTKLGGSSFENGSLYNKFRSTLVTSEYSSSKHHDWVLDGDMNVETYIGDVSEFSVIKEYLTTDKDENNFTSVKYFQKHQESSSFGELLLSVGDVCAVIPKYNQSGHIYSDFKLNVIQDVLYHPSSNLWQCLASPVVHMQPHGAKFFSSDPAIIFLPITVHLEADDEIICLCSDTEIGENLKWRVLSSEDYEVYDGFIKIRANHFSFYTSVVKKGYPEASKMIYAGEGGTLEVPGLPGVEVIFPASAVQYDIKATVKVMFADGPYDVDHEDPTAHALAAPVIKLGPTGHQFNPESEEPVQVRLPLPSGRDILENCGRPFLTFWQSTTAEGQDLEWKLFHTDYRIDVDNDGLYSVYFPVTHFTFFRVLWSIFDSVVNEAKIGASFFFPNFPFYVGFQAFMSENDEDKTFGLCFLCYKMGNPPEPVGNYPVFVGSKVPRMVKCGLLQIRVCSKLFEANNDFGEEVLSQQEVFTGRPFDKQFACRYICPKVPVFGTIGKVYVERLNDDGTVEPLFDFLLTKPQPAQEVPQAASGGFQNGGKEEHDESWEGKLSSELATVLSIKTNQDLGDDVWEDIARALGYTALEIDMKFKGEAEPLEKLVKDYKRRGGSPNDLITAMYTVGRKENIREYEQRIRSVLPEGESSSEDDVVGHNGSISPSRTSSLQNSEPSSSGIVLPSMPINNRKRRHSNNGPVSEAKLADIAAKVQSHWKRLGRALELDEDQIREIDRDYENEGIQEQAYQMLLAWKQRYPDNGYDSLAQALGKLHLNGVARQLYFN